MSIPNADTAQRLKTLKIETGLSWRDLAVHLGYRQSYAATLCAVAKRKRNCISRPAEDLLRQRLQLGPLPRTRYLYLRFRADETELRAACAAQRDALRKARRQE